MSRQRPRLVAGGATDGAVKLTARSQAPPGGWNAMLDVHGTVESAFEKPLDRWPRQLGPLCAEQVHLLAVSRWAVHHPMLWRYLRGPP